MPVKPTGAMATGILAVDAHHGGGGGAVFHVHGHALAQLDLLEIRFIGTVCAFSTEPESA